MYTMDWQHNETGRNTKNEAHPCFAVCSGRLSTHLEKPSLGPSRCNQWRQWPPPTVTFARRTKTLCCCNCPATYRLVITLDIAVLVLDNEQRLYTPTGAWLTAGFVPWMTPLKRERSPARGASDWLMIPDARRLCVCGCFGISVGSTSRSSCCIV